MILGFLNYNKICKDGLRISPNWLLLKWGINLNSLIKCAKDIHFWVLKSWYLLSTSVFSVWLKLKYKSRICSFENHLFFHYLIGLQIIFYFLSISIIYSLFIIFITCLFYRIFLLGLLKSLPLIFSPHVLPYSNSFGYNGYFWIIMLFMSFSC